MSTRQKHSPAEKAQKALDTVTRKIERLTVKSQSLTAELAKVNADLEAAIARREYLAQSPDLPSETSADVASIV